jgi:hypothetical protein
MDQNNTPVLHTCAISGEQSPGKHYILKTTEGEELVCPEALFHNGADRRLVVALVELQNRVALLEGDKPEDQGDDDEDQGDEDQAAAEPKPAPAKKAAAKKAAAKKTAARKAVD